MTYYITQSLSVTKDNLPGQVYIDQDPRDGTWYLYGELVDEVLSEDDWPTREEALQLAYRLLDQQPDRPTLLD